MKSRNPRLEPLEQRQMLSLVISGDASVDVGEPCKVLLTVPTAPGPSSWVIDWGDIDPFRVTRPGSGSDWGSGVIQTSDTTWELTHTYTDSGVYNFQVTVLPGDASFDGAVGYPDAAILSANWLGTGKTWRDGDFNFDGTVNDIDATIMAVNWGASYYGGSSSITVEGLPTHVAPGGPGAGGISNSGVCYGSGDVLLTANDFAVSRSYSAHSSAVTRDCGVGFGWQMQDWPYLVEGDGEAAVIFGGQQVYWYTVSGDTWTPQFGALQTVTHDTGNHLFKFLDTDGTVYEFDDFTHTDSRRGQFRRAVASSGATSEVVSWTANGDIEEIQRTLVGAAQPYESQFYTWANGRVSSVILRENSQSGSVSWENTRKATYDYYADEDYGLTGDLKTAINQIWNGAGWAGDDTYYYRYYIDDAGGTGFEHGLKMALSPEDYVAAVTNLGGDPDLWSDANTKTYASAYYEYNSDQRATEATTGNDYTYGYTYYDSGSLDGENTWARQAVETMLDGSTKTVYSNYLGQVLLTDIYDAASTAHTVSYSVYGTSSDANAGNDNQLILFANPSAVSDYAKDGNQRWNQSDPTPITFTVDGLVYETTYTAAGYVEYELVRKAANDPTPDYVSGVTLSLSNPNAAVLQHYDYIPHAVGSNTVYFVSAVTEYKHANGDYDSGDGWITTTYGYDSWHSGTFQVQEQTVTLPVVTTEQNGSNTSAVIQRWYDENGNLNWTIDERNRVTYYEYHSITGLLMRMVEDVNSGESLGVTPPGGYEGNADGLHLITNYAYDDEGRLIEVLGPAHIADINGSAVNVRTASWTAYLNDGHEYRIAQGYKEVTSGVSTIVGPISITKTDSDGRTIDEIQATYSDTVANLGTATILQSQYRAWTTYQYEDSRLVSMRVYDDIANLGYEQTSYGYESLGAGRLNRTQTPDGTITRQVYDARGNVLETWMGTNDENATDEYPNGIGPSNNNMVQVAGYTYDADSNLVTSTDYADTLDQLTTMYQYDWRGRQTEVFSPGDVVTQYEYDNLGRTLLIQTYASDDTTLSSNELRAQTRNLYDDLNRVYESRVYNVDPTDGYIDTYLPTNYWYDAAGNLIKSADGKLSSDWSTVTGYWLANKYVYDGLGRQVMAYTCFDIDEIYYNEVCDLLLTGDTVVEQTQTWYNDASEIVATANYARLPNDTASTGPLDATSGQSNSSYVTASVFWYDGLGRSTASAFYGREDAGSGETQYFFNGANPDTDANGIPDRAEVDRPQTYVENPGSAAGIGFQLLLTQYNDAGLAYRTIDDLGRKDETRYDNVGRVVKTIQNWVDYVAGTPAETDTEEDIVTDYEYDSGGRLVTMTAYNAKGSGKGIDSQSTKYLYESEINASWQTAVVYPDSDDVVQQLVPATQVWTITTDNGDHVSTAYDRLGRIDYTTDQRGIVHTYSYDTAGRLVLDAVTAPSGWGDVDSMVQSVRTAYDDVGRVYSIANCSDAAGTNILNQIKYRYDYWGNVDREFQEHNGEADDDWNPTYWSKNVGYDYDDGSYIDDAYYDAAEDCYAAQYMRLDLVYYPKVDGTARQVDYLFTVGSIDDLMSRPTSIDNNSARASYKYLGANRIVTEDFTDIEIKLDHSAGNFAALDRFGRVEDQLWADYGTNWDGELYDPSNTYPDYFSYTYNRAGNIATRINEQNNAFNETYTYDELYRLTVTDRALGTADDQSWGLDGQGNFGTFNDGGAPQTRTVDEANQIESISGWITPQYDTAGNMISGPRTGDETERVHYVYDAWNRLVAVLADDPGDPGSPGDTIVEYVYDGLNRRIMKSEDKDDPYAWNRQYYYNQDWQIVEDNERLSGNLVEVNQYIWSLRYVDAPLACLHDGNASGDVDDGYPTDWRRYYLTDAQHNVTTTIRVDDDNDIASDGVVRNVYEAYGGVARFNEAWGGDNVEAFFDSPLYSGYFYDTETSLYQVRNRFYDTGLATFLNRDPIGYNSSDTNLYRYCENDPVDLHDAYGTRIKSRYDIGEYLSKYATGSSKRIKGNWLYYHAAESGKGDLRTEIIVSMLNSTYIYEVAGDSKQSCLDNIKKHVETRVKIVELAKAKEYRFGADTKFTQHFTIPGVDYTKDPLKYYNSINNSKTAIACQWATMLTFFAGIGKWGEDYGIRKYSSRNLLVPGDWGYIDNLANNANRTRKPDDRWEPGLEGENVIYVGGNKLWGHFSSGVITQPYEDWKLMIDSWEGEDKKTGEKIPGKAMYKVQIKYPTVGLKNKRR